MNKSIRSILAMFVAMTTMLAFVLPRYVYAQDRTKGTITIEKLTVVDDTTNNPVKDVGFTIYKVPDNAELTTDANGDKKIVYASEDGTEMTYTKSDTDMVLDGTTKLTGADGRVTTGELEVGRYYVEEVTVPAEVTQRADSFLVDVPTYTVDTNGVITANYNPVVQPKNTLGFGSLSTVVKDKSQSNDTTNVYVEGAKIVLQKKEVDDAGNEKYVTITPDDITNVDTTNPDFVVDNESKLTTDENGNIDIANLPVGEYQVILTDVPEGYILDESPRKFTVENVTDDEGNSSVVVKDEEGNTITQIVIEIDTVDVVKAVNDDDVTLGDTVTYTLNVHVPTAEIARMKTFNVIDTYGAGITMLTDTILCVSGTNTLTKGTDYMITNANNVLTIAFTKNGRTKLAENSTLTITYDAKFSSAKEYVAGDTDALTNKANVEYTNRVSTYDVRYNSDEYQDYGELKDDTNDKSNTQDNPNINTPDINDPDTTENDNPDSTSLNTYGFVISKIDGGLLAGSAPLAGAEFKVSKVNNQTDADGDPTDVITLYDGTNDTATFVTGDDGKITVYGLESGTYYLYETKAPTYTEDDEEKAYVKLTAPVEIVVNTATTELATSSDATVTVKNNKPSVLPATGAVCTAGLLILGCAMAVYGYKLLKKE